MENRIKNIPLQKLLQDISVQRIVNLQNPIITEICNNSHKASPNSLFIAIQGAKTDGHLYINEAIEKGCTVIICAYLPDICIDHITYVLVSNTSLAMAHIASAFYDYPSTKLKLVAITGTSGKTTTVHLLCHVFARFGHKVGLLSTINNKIAETILSTDLTTPDAITINELLAKMVEQGCEYCFMEASSHAIEQYRIGALQFAGAAFLNITHEHLDYHQTFANYINAKKKLFDELSSNAFALVNADDRHAGVMLQNTKAKKYTYALKSNADFNARIISNTMQGLELHIDGQSVWIPLVGEFNAYNILTAYSIAILLGKTSQEVLVQLSLMQPVPGRFQCVHLTNNITAVVDYAHKPDALQNLLTTIRKIKTGSSKIILVFGCGGNRDTAKRPIMTAIACKASDTVILTSDNPRYEDPEEIINQMKTGVSAEMTNKILAVTNRAEAIKVACKLATSGDLVVIAGKGHESYQEISGAKLPFDDLEIVKKCFALV